jgi:hypothetical protein
VKKKCPLFIASIVGVIGLWMELTPEFMLMMVIEKQILHLQDLINIQSTNGNYDCNPYMWGLANGLILAMSLFTGNEPNFLSQPEKWLDDQQSEELVERNPL